MVMKLRVVEVAPARLKNDAPWFVLCCHCTVGAGVPVAEAVNVTEWPDTIVWLTGLVMITGATGAAVTVSVAAVVAGCPVELVKTARYSLPDCPVDVVKLYVVELAPGILTNVAPWFVLTCHCTVGAGVPVAAAVNVTPWPVTIVWLTGLSVITGAAVTVSVAAKVVACPCELVKTARY